MATQTKKTEFTNEDAALYLDVSTDTFRRVRKQKGIEPSFRTITDKWDRPHKQMIFTQHQLDSLKPHILNHRAIAPREYTERRIPNGPPSRNQLLCIYAFAADFGLSKGLIAYRQGSKIRKGPGWAGNDWKPLKTFNREVTVETTSINGKPYTYTIMVEFFLLGDIEDALVTCRDGVFDISPSPGETGRYVQDDNTHILNYTNAVLEAGGNSRIISELRRDFDLTFTNGKSGASRRREKHTSEKVLKDKLLERAAKKDGETIEHEGELYDLFRKAVEDLDRPQQTVRHWATKRGCPHLPDRRKIKSIKSYRRLYLRRKCIEQIREQLDKHKGRLRPRKARKQYGFLPQKLRDFEAEGACPWHPQGQLPFEVGFGYGGEFHSYDPKDLNTIKNNKSEGKKVFVIPEADPHSDAEEIRQILATLKRPDLDPGIFHHAHKVGSPHCKPEEKLWSTTRLGSLGKPVRVYMPRDVKAFITKRDIALKYPDRIADSIDNLDLWERIHPLLPKLINFQDMLARLRIHRLNGDLQEGVDWCRPAHSIRHRHKTHLQRPYFYIFERAFEVLKSDFEEPSATAPTQTSPTAPKQADNKPADGKPQGGRPSKWSDVLSARQRFFKGKHSIDELRSLLKIDEEQPFLTYWNRRFAKRNGRPKVTRKNLGDALRTAKNSR